MKKESVADLKRANDLFKKIFSVLKPPPKLTIDTWSDKYRILSTKTSSEPGRWNTDRVPFQREVMRAISDKRTEKVVMMYGAQLSKTEILMNTFGFYADYDPAPIMFLMPTKDMAQDFSSTRLNDMILSTPQLRNKIIESDNSRDTKRQKEFAGGYIVLTGSNSAAELSSRPIRILLADEIDRFPSNVKGEGDPLNLAIERTKTFWNKKIVLTSTPTIKGGSRVELEYENSTKEEYYVPCPKCGEMQTLKWRNIMFEDVTHKCEKCLETSSEYEWKRNLIKGEWRAHNSEVDRFQVRGFHISELYSPFSKWDSIINKFKAAKGDEQLMKVFVNTALGECWEEKVERFNFEEIHARAEDYGEYLNHEDGTYEEVEIPERVNVLTAGVDVQDNRLEVEIVGWAKGEESWGIYYKVIMGNPALPYVWNELDQVLMKDYSYQNGEKIRVACACVDTGGHHTDDVYRYVKAKEQLNIFGIKGSGETGRPLISRPSKNNKGGISLFVLGVNTGKDTIMSNLKVKEPGAKYMHYPNNPKRGYDEVYFKGLTSEIKVVTFSKGQAKIEWKTVGDKRNEPLDIRNYAQAALRIANPDLDIRYSTDLLNGLRTQRVSRKRKILSKGIK
ncbi:phage terminase large subunit family protein [Leptotrichia wadei]|uniref:phage terminase large subunit family protein n=1 Tax=Leptotrichia wadei TaxID=157687 RepID=UPI0028E7D4B8|nr:phage terminase large subunit family protein [Leptotrichia wadei]